MSRGLIDSNTETFHVRIGQERSVKYLRVLRSTTYVYSQNKIAFVCCPQITDWSKGSLAGGDSYEVDVHYECMMHGTTPG